MKAKWLPISAAVIMALGSASASAVDFHGYARAGLNYNTEGGSAYCPGNGRDGHSVGRLGAECDTYAEIVLGQEVYNKGGNKFDVSTLVAYNTPEGNVDAQGNGMQGSDYTDPKTDAGPWAGQRTSMREMYGTYTMNDGKAIWAGKRFYGRKDIHQLDLYYLNDSGYGGGIENVKAGPGAFSFAVTKGAIDGTNLDDVDAWRNTYKADVRYGNIAANANGVLDFVVIGAFPNLSDAQKAGGVGDENGVLLHAEHTQGAFFGGFNKFIVQYATNGFTMGVGGAGNRGAGNHAGEVYNPIEGDAWRVIDWGTMDFGSWDLGYSAIYAEASVDKDSWMKKGDTQQYSFVVRPGYKWNEIMKTTMEIGYSADKGEFYSGGTKDDWDGLTKVTLAQSFSAGTGFWARPSLRFFATYLTGDKIEASTYGKRNDTDNEVILGTQLEAWW